MNLPTHLQQEVEKWAMIQGIEPERFIAQVIADKIKTLNQTSESDDSNSTEPNLYYEGSVLVSDAKLPSNFDVNAFIEELREERIREQMGL